METVVLLHSSASSAAQWRALVAQLSGRYRVVAPDLYGYGSTPNWPGRGAFSLAHEAEIVHALIGDAGEPAHLVGHSYGGAVALHVARLRGERVRSLALIEPVAFHLLTDSFEVNALAESVARAIACGDYFGGCRSFIDYWSGPGSWDALPLATRDAIAPRLAKVALDFHAVFDEPAGVDDFRRMAVPTLLVQGAHSPQPTRRVCELLAGALPDAWVKTIDGAGHMAPLTHRDAVNAAITAHLESNSTQGGNHATHYESRSDAAGASGRRLREHLAGPG